MIDDELFSLFQHPAPIATVYVPTPSAIEDAGERVAITWKDLRRELERERLPEGLLAALDELVGTEHRDMAAQMAAVSGDGARVSRQLSVPIDRPAAWVDTLPRVGPVLEWQQRLLPHVVVVADRVGADIVAVSGGEQVAAEAVEADTYPLRKVHAGGWSQRRYQERAENTWEHNATAVAEEVAAVAEDVGAELVIAAGDERALGFLRQHLPARWQPHLRVVDGARHGGDSDRLAVEIVTEVDTLVAEHTRDVLRAFAEERGRGGLAADGPDDTLAALNVGAVATLLINDDPDDERRAWFVRGTSQAAANRDALGDAAEEGRLIDVAIGAAHATDADIRVVPGAAASSPTGAVGALLRFRPNR